MLKNSINFKKIILRAFILFEMIVSIGAVASLQPALVYADNSTPNFAATSAKDAACKGVGLATGSGCKASGDNTDISSVIKNVIKIISVIVGVAAVVMIIIGGFKYITSGGEASNTASAKNTILYAIVGLVIVAVAQVIVRYVLTNVPQ